MSPRVRNGLYALGAVLLLVQAPIWLMLLNVSISDVVRQAFVGSGDPVLIINLEGGTFVIVSWAIGMASMWWIMRGAPAEKPDETASPPVAPSPEPRIVVSMGPRQAPNRRDRPRWPRGWVPQRKRAWG